MSSGKVLVAESEGVHVLKFIGDVRVTLGHSIDTFFIRLLECQNFKSVIIDLTETIGIDSTSLGLLAKISIQTQDAFGIVPTIISTNQDITRILESMGFDRVFIIVEQPVKSAVQLGELPPSQLTETALREKVLEAHQVLMRLNEENQLKFRDLVDALENECRRAS